MTNIFSQGLLIAGIGMGLVFVALILLWGLMALMARIRFKSDGNRASEETAPEPAAAVAPVEGASSDLRRRAAVAAVAAALGLRMRAVRITPPTPKSLSPWQVARRSGQFSHNNTVTNRKTRGSAR